MPKIKQTAKRLRQAKKRTVRNRHYRTTSRTYLKRARAALESGDREAAQQAVDRACSYLDHAVTKGVIHKNKASRLKSRLTRQLQSL